MKLLTVVLVLITKQSLHASFILNLFRPFCRTIMFCKGKGRAIVTLVPGFRSIPHL